MNNITISIKKHISPIFILLFLLPIHFANATGEQILQAEVNELKVILQFLLVENKTPIGSIVAFAGTKETIPKGWLLCDGKSLAQKNYPDLYKVIQTAWGNGSNDNNPKTNFNLPDLRGRFLRGAALNTTNDPDKSKRTASAKGGNTGNKVGTVQSDATKMPNAVFKTEPNGKHHHKVPTMGVTAGKGPEVASRRSPKPDFDGTFTENGGKHNHIITGGDKETRPKNASVHFIIKAY